MKLSQLLSLACLSPIVLSQLIALPSFLRGATPPPLPKPADQEPLMHPVGPGPAIPPGGGSGGGGEGAPPSAPGAGSVMLSDVMGRDRSINIFAGFTRDIESVSRRLDDSGQNSTVLAPLNSQIEKLPRKPWEDPKDYDAIGAEAYEGQDGQDRAQRNLRRFVEAHIIPASPWRDGERVKALVGDRDLWWEEKDGVRVVSSFSLRSRYLLKSARVGSGGLTREQIHPDEIEVVSIASTVANGEVVSDYSLIVF